jgi:BTB/POZ domain
MSSHPAPILTIKLITSSDLTIRAIQQKDGEARVADISISKATLVENSEYFRAMFRSGWADAGKTIVVIEGYTIQSIELWMRIFHRASTDLESSMSLQDVWYALKA